MRKNVLFFAALAMLALVSWQVSADTVIGVNFCDTWEAPHLAGETADGLSNWTDSGPINSDHEISYPNGTGLVVLGSNDLVTCDWSSPNTWAAGPETNSEEQLYRVYLDDGGSGCLVTINGLSAWMLNEGLGAYTIRIYHSTDTDNNRFMPVDIKEGSTILQTVQETNMFNAGDPRAYVDSGILTADTIILDPQPKVSDYRATIAGFKISGVDKFIPINPDPGIGQEVPVNQDVSWEQAAAASGLGVTYNVYFGTEPNETNPNYYGSTPVKTTTDDPGDFNYTPTLENSKTYYWRVDAIDPNNGNPTAHAGPEWWFITQPPSPRIETDPVSLTVSAGTAQIQFSVTGINIDTYQWYKDGLPLADDPTDTLYAGEDSDTLIIYDVQIADEGFYSCEGDNSLNPPDTSASAQLLTERLVGHWKLDGDLTDSIDDEITGATAHDGVSVDPNYVPVGKDGGALEFFGDVESLVAIADSNDYFNFYPLGMTVSAWIKTAHTGWDGYLSKHGDGSGWTLDMSDGNESTHFTVRGSHGDLWGNDDDGSMYDENWHLVTAVIDRTTQTSRIYVDGILRNESGTYAKPNTTATALIFGAEGDTGAVLINNTMIDDVRIWSYPLDPVAIAGLYVDFNPGTEVCVVNPEYDVAGPGGVGDEFRDCVVNLCDFVPFVQGWLDCNIVPDCLP